MGDVIASTGQGTQCLCGVAPRSEVKAKASNLTNDNRSGRGRYRTALYVSLSQGRFSCSPPGTPKGLALVPRSGDV
jgi:hypothetical protein